MFELNKWRLVSFDRKRPVTNTRPHETLLHTTNIQTDGQSRLRTGAARTRSDGVDMAASRRGGGGQRTRHSPGLRGPSGLYDADDDARPFAQKGFAREAQGRARVLLFTTFFFG